MHPPTGFGDMTFAYATIKKEVLLPRWKPQASVTEVTCIWMYSPLENSFLQLGPNLNEENILKIFYHLTAMLTYY